MVCSIHWLCVGMSVLTQGYPGHPPSPPHPMPQLTTPAKCQAVSPGPLERDSCDSLHDSLVTAYLERGEEGAVDEGGLEVAEPGRHVPGHPEVGVLVSRVNILIHN